MGIATEDTLLEFLRDSDARALKLKGIRDSGDSIYLGAVGLSLIHPMFHNIRGFAFSGRLSTEAGFRIETVTWPDSDRTDLVAIFRQFEISPYQDTPEDIIVGWVPISEANNLAIWMARMTSQLAHLLEIDAAEERAEAEAQAKASTATLAES